jgi:hypothetical protein
MAFCSFIGIEATRKKGQYISVNLLKATVLQKKKKKNCEKERKKCRN